MSGNGQKTEKITPELVQFTILERSSYENETAKNLLDTHYTIGEAQCTIRGATARILTKY